MAMQARSSREPRFHLPPEPPLKLADDVIEGEVIPLNGVDEVDPRAWREIDGETPRDGMVIEVKPDRAAADEVVWYARWRVTRRRDAALRQWVQVGMWCNPMNNQPLEFEPVVWRMQEAFRLPGTMA